MSTRFAYALFLTICGAALNLVLYFTGAQTVKLATGHYFLWLQEVFLAVVLWLGIKAVREKSPGHAFSYGQGVGSGVLISLYAGLMTGVYNALHFGFVNPHFADYQLACLRPEWNAAGMSAADMAQAEKNHPAARDPARATHPHADHHGAFRPCPVARFRRLPEAPRRADDLPAVPAELSARRREPAARKLTWTWAR